MKSIKSINTNIIYQYTYISISYFLHQPIKQFIICDSVYNYYAKLSNLEHVLATKIILNPFYENFKANHFTIQSDAPVINTQDPLPYLFKFVLDFHYLHNKHIIFVHFNKRKFANLDNFYKIQKHKQIYQFFNNLAVKKEQMDLLHIHHRLIMLHNKLISALDEDTFLGTSHFGSVENSEIVFTRIKNKKNRKMNKKKNK